MASPPLHLQQLKAVCRPPHDRSRLALHAAALRARAARTLSKLCEGVATGYNERSYDGRSDGESGRDGDEGRGWCAAAPPSPLYPVCFAHAHELYILSA